MPIESFIYLLFLFVLDRNETMRDEGEMLCQCVVFLSRRMLVVRMLLRKVTEQRSFETMSWTELSAKLPSKVLYWNRWKVT